MVEYVRQWTPGDGVLIARVREAFADAAQGAGGLRHRSHWRRLRHSPLTPYRTTSSPWRRPATYWNREADVTRGFLAAHAFANWTAHLGDGLRSWLRTIEIAGGLLETGVGVRRADLILRHLAAPDALAEIASRAERD